MATAPACSIKVLEGGSVHLTPLVSSDVADVSKRSRHWVTEPEACMDIPLADTGYSSVPEVTVADIIKKAVEKHSSEVCVRWEAEVQDPPVLVGWTWAEYYQKIRQTASAYLALGFTKGTTVSILGFNCKEWFLAELGAIIAGGKACGIYTTNGPSACEYVVSHSESKFVLCENSDYLSRFADLKLPSVKHFVVWSGTVSDDLKQKLSAPVLTWAEFAAKGSESDEAVDAAMASQKAGECCLLVYTSGTTGNPKAVMLSHDNLVAGARAVVLTLKPKPQKEFTVSYLPLSHIAGQQLDMLGPCVYAAETCGNMCVTFARPDALRGSLRTTLVAVRPTVFLGVPRVYEKMMDAIREIAAKQNSAAVKAVGDWAKGKGRLAFEASQAGQTGGKPWGYFLASVIFNKVHQKLGFDRCKDYCFTGAAPISGEVLRYFGSIGIGIKELYGMSETAAVGIYSTDEWRRTGSVGIVLAGTEIMLVRDASRGDPERTGELCMRGRHTMMGYMKDEEKTKETIDDEGWLHSGDVASVDDLGMISITGRIKELIITAGGENIAPVPIEDYIKKVLPCVSNCMLVGDRRKFNSIVLTLRTKTDQNGENFSNELVGGAVKFASTSATTVEEARASKEYNAAIQEGIDKYNKEEAVSNAQKIQKFSILDHDFTIGGGEMTGTLKLRRKVVEDKYKEAIEAMY